MAFRQLGLGMAGVFRRARPRIERLAQLMGRGQVASAGDDIARTYLDGRRTGWTVHGLQHGASANISPLRAREWADSGLEHSASVVARTQRLLEDDTEGTITVALIQRLAEIITRLAAWEGADDGGEDVADEVGAEWKEWVRTLIRRDIRDHHAQLEGVIIPRDQLFFLPGGPNVGASVDGPRDWRRVGDPGEWVNCGHGVRYHTRIIEADLRRAATVARLRAEVSR